MQASVIIPTYRRQAFLSVALDSVLAQDFPATEFEIIVVDNAPQPTPELEKLCGPSAQPPVRYVNEPRNGLHNARHAGARAANGEILVYIDDDVLCPSGWLGAMVNPYTDAQVAMVAGRVMLRYDVEPPPWLEQFRGILSALDWGDTPHALPPYGSPVGCNMSVRKLVLFELGGFNPDGFSDQSLIHLRGDGENGLACKVHDAGWTVWYAPKAWLEHRVTRSRMQKSYIEWRSAIGGIESAYVDLRYNPRNVLALLLGGGRSMLASLYHWSLMQRYRGNPDRSMWHCALAARARHHALQRWRQLTSSKLRQYTFQKSYV